MKLKYTSTNEYGLSRGSERAAAFDLRADKDYHFGVLIGYLIGLLALGLVLPYQMVTLGLLLSVVVMGLSVISLPILVSLIVIIVEKLKLKSFGIYLQDRHLK